MNKKNNLQIIILAAGKSVRFKSKISKLIHELLGKPMIVRIIELAEALEPSRILVVVGDNKEDLGTCICDKKVTLVCQKRPLGTGHALAQCEQHVDFQQPLLVMNADTPLMKQESLRRFIETGEYNDNTMHLLTAEMSNPSNYGRIIRNSRNKVTAIKEDIECTAT